MVKLRIGTGHSKITATPYRGGISIVTARRPIIEDAWAELSMLGRDYEVYKNVALRHGNKSKQSATNWKLFSAYVNQARQYYENASKIRDCSAALFYYYSFLNLAKGYIVLRSPKKGGGISAPAHHGIGIDTSSLSSVSSIKLKLVSGALTTYWRLVFQKTPPNNKTLKLMDLLNYCGDISYELGMAGYHNRRNDVIKVRRATDNNASGPRQWLVLAIPKRFNTSTISATHTRFPSTFSQVTLSAGGASPDRQWVRRVFNIPLNMIGQFEYWQQKRPIRKELIQNFEFNKIIFQKSPGLFSDIIDDSEYDCVINLPIDVKSSGTVTSIPMNEEFAICAAMFGFGSVVRYYPDSLEKILRCKDGWISENFIQVCGEVFVRHMRNRIFENTLKA
jgi:hypothetical protein